MQLTGKLDDIEKFACITPTLGNSQTKNGLVAFVDSHEWEIDANEMHEDSFISKIHCSNCGLECTLIGSNVHESAKRATKHREDKIKRDQSQVEKIAIEPNEALWAVYMGDFRPQGLDLLPHDPRNL